MPEHKYQFDVTVTKLVPIENTAFSWHRSAFYYIGPDQLPTGRYLIVHKWALALDFLGTNDTFAMITY